MIDASRHLVLCANHPSPLSALAATPAIHWLWPLFKGESLASDAHQS
jgi:hypothetical protein